MIRNVVLGQLRPAADTEQAAADRRQLETGLAGVAGLKLPGLLAVQLGRDLGLRDGGWDFAITNDWADEQSYRDYDADPEHNSYRTLIVAVCASVARVQFALD